MSNNYSSYSKAIYSFSLEENKVKKYLTISKDISLALEEQKSFLKYLSDYGVSQEDKISLLKKIIKDKSYLNWILILIKDRKINMLDLILKKHINLFNEDNDILEGEVWTTIKLNEPEIKKIENKLKTKLNKKVSLVNKIDKELIGGIKVEIKNDIWENTVVSKIDQIIKELKKEEV